MKNKIPGLLTVILCAAVIFGFAAWSIVKPDEAVSAAERRSLAQMPDVSLGAVLGGSFMSEFESYALDQFPMRDELRTLKAGFSLELLRQKDNNGYYLASGHAAKLDYTLNGGSVDNAAERFGYVYDRYLKDSGCKVYLSLVPDKSYYMTVVQPTLDFDALSEMLCGMMPYAEYIDLAPSLGLDCYYRTDPHWDQAKLTGTAQTMADAMGTALSGEYSETVLSDSFRGAYAAQLAMPMQPDKLTVLTSDVLNACTVYDFESGKTTGLYDKAAADGLDAYSVFLNGSRALLTVENPAAESTRELIIFRDSFGSSIAPLLAEGYAKITLVDIRYISPERLDKFVSFSGQDVLFLYSSSVINSSGQLL